MAKQYRINWWKFFGYKILEIGGAVVFIYIEYLFGKFLQYWNGQHFTTNPIPLFFAMFLAFVFTVIGLMTGFVVVNGLISLIRKWIKLNIDLSLEEVKK